MVNKLRVLHLIKSLGRGGAEMLLPETLKVHDREHFDFHFAYFLPWKDQMVPAIEALGATAICFKAKNNLQMFQRVREISRYVRENQIDVIHSHLPWAGLIARLVGKKTGVPVVYTEHNKWERYNKITYWLNKLSFGWQQAAVAVSDDVQQSIRKNAGIDFSQLDVAALARPTMPQTKTQLPYLLNILNGVNTVHFVRDEQAGLQIRQELGIPANAPVIGTVSVFRFQKRLDLWMEIAAAILQKMPEAHFILVGDGPLKEELLAKRKALGIEEHLHMPGLKTDVNPYFSAMDIYMMSSIFEGLPIALLEAMSCGCAIISTTAGGVAEVVEQDKSGLLCDVDDYTKLVDHGIQLFQNPDQRQALATGARSRVEADFSINKMAKQLEALYLYLKEERG
ncbi:glycosyltransferase [Pontibacter ramchanderi]|uniref:Glycosyltransferase involved in cell wall biosynthesis n=1 Tax=Pontibacter ramchanderi TaxID=1179743 RepID=A0A2N3U8Z7_9BACT|nr:glycosyltransferase [Pontibacter ramchanderi]PKV63217.1 glycosyltransferase involved in cell wall biosynthesis [Pontibacter ramchanderi]